MKLIRFFSNGREWTDGGGNDPALHMLSVFNVCSFLIIDRKDNVEQTAYVRLAHYLYLSIYY